MWRARPPTLLPTPRGTPPAFRRRGRETGFSSAPRTREVRPSPERGRAKLRGGTRQQQAVRGARVTEGWAGRRRFRAETSQCLDLAQWVADLGPLPSLCRGDGPGPFDGLCCGIDLDGVPPQQKCRPRDTELGFRAPGVSPAAPSHRRGAGDGVHPLTAGSVSLSSVTRPRCWASFPGWQSGPRGRWEQPRRDLSCPGSDLDPATKP